MIINRNIINILNCIVQGANKLGYSICSLYAEITDTHTVFYGGICNKEHDHVENFRIMIYNNQLLDNIEYINIETFLPFIRISIKDIEKDEYVQNRYLIADKINAISNKLNELYDVSSIHIDYYNDDIIVVEYLYSPKNREDIVYSSCMKIRNEYYYNYLDVTEVLYEISNIKYNTKYQTNSCGIIWLDIEPDISDLESYNQLLSSYNTLVIPGEIDNELDYEQVSFTFSESVHGAYVLFDPCQYSSDFVIMNYPIKPDNFKIIKVS